MSDKLNSSLDDILKTTRGNARRGRGPRRSGVGRTTEAPIGGVAKATKQTKPNKAAPTAPAATSGGETKIMISNLPFDVEENQLKEYFNTVVNVGKPRRILLQYGPNGKSLGSATVIFNKAEQAIKATSALQGVKIDNKPIRVEMLVSAAAVASQPQSSFADRITHPKKADKPKPATAAKAVPAGGRERGRGRGDRAAGRGRGRGGRERTKKKTQEELDAEMEDYFPAAEGGNDAMVTNGDAPQAGGGDTMEEDQML
ncbi:RNA-binding RNA annealing protein [Didymosphaeria variabile]|uniref:RNA-binding RNA annealing protein n=1 Tax=Didymosphaeria variabile TaxID=1932322 RepID=A0A9W8XPK7_9PLEO|nr:RNA-binding RNA annealing protein [Didymosphaeria variabile]KAJ4354588.1 RNA-binding RNA annealing protein [Didymosphaeria variabile]